MQSRLSGLSLYLKICFIVILFVAHVVAPPVSGSELVHRADQAGPANEPHDFDLGDPDRVWEIMIAFFYPFQTTLKSHSISIHAEKIAETINNRIKSDTEISKSDCRKCSLNQLPSLLPSGMSYEGDVSLRLTWHGPNHVFESRGKITANGGISEVNTIDVEFSLPANDAGLHIRKPGAPGKIAFTVPVYRTQK